MAYTSGTAANYKELLATLTTFAAANGWTVLTQSETEVYLRGSGTSGLDAIYCGIRAFENVDASTYNWQLYGSVFWKAHFDIDAQPLTSVRAIYAYFWDHPIAYWMVATPRRIILVAKVSTAYQHVHLGHIDPIGTAGQYPYPLYIGGQGNSSGYSYSSTTTSAYWASLGSKGALRMPGGLWCEVNSAGAVARIGGLYESLRLRTITAPDGSYLLEPLYIKHSGSLAVYGQLHGLYRVSGYQNSSENTITVSGANYMAFQNGHRSTIGDYCALRMD